MLGVHLNMRCVALTTIVFLTAAAATYGWCRFRIHDLQNPTLRALNARRRHEEIPPPLSVDQTTSSKRPPFSGMGMQMRWNYSDLVCTGIATLPKHTGEVKRIGGTDRDQLVSFVTIESCFKGKAPADRIRVIGYGVVALRETVGGYVYSGPPPGFVEKGRNLFFLRKTGDPRLWDVTVPVYQTCIPLAQLAPGYALDGSADGIRNALAAEMENAILTNPPTVTWYFGYVLDLLDEKRGLDQLKRLSRNANKDLRRQIALTLLWHNDQDGEGEVLSLLRDSGAVSWQRANAARALRNATSPQARQALEEILKQPAPDEVRSAARESLMQIGR